MLFTINALNFAYDREILSAAHMKSIIMVQIGDLNEHAKFDSFISGWSEVMIEKLIASDLKLKTWVTFANSRIKIRPVSHFSSLTPLDF